jgi:hypothetical protein
MGTGEELANTNQRDGEKTRELESKSVHHVLHGLEHKFWLINGPRGGRKNEVQLTG